MRNIRSRRTRCKCRSARIGKEIEHLRGYTSLSLLNDAVVDKIPVRRLLGEDTDVLKRGQRQAHLKIHSPVAVLHRPAVGHRSSALPLATLIAL